MYVSRVPVWKVSMPAVSHQCRFLFAFSMWYLGTESKALGHSLLPNYIQPTLGRRVHVCFYLPSW